MREMKSSGIEWIGEIPKNWSICRLKDFCIFQTGTTPPLSDGIDTEDEGLEWYTPADLALGSIYPLEAKHFISWEAINKYKIHAYPSGSILFVGIASSIGKLAYMSHEAYSNQQITAIKPYKNASKYVAYFLLVAEDFIKEDALYTTVPIVNNTYLGTLQILIPPIKEQCYIVDFLDRKCSEIDSLTADIEEQIEMLEQYKRNVITEAVTKGLDPDAEIKDSGVEWIGEIPVEWETTKIDALYSLRNEKVSDKDYPPLSVTMQGIVPQLENAAKTNDGDNRKLVRKGDFAINSRSDRRGSCGISEYDGSVSLINTVLCPKSNMHPGYYNWLFHSPLFSDEFYRWGHGIVDDLWTTNWRDMKKILLPVPPLSEQALISDFLDNKCSEIDDIIAEKKSQLDTLAEYKKSLIYEYVTGKKEVPAS